MTYTTFSNPGNDGWVCCFQARKVWAHHVMCGWQQYYFDPKETIKFYLTRTIRWDYSDTTFYQEVYKINRLTKVESLFSTSGTSEGFPPGGAVLTLTRTKWTSGLIGDAGSYYEELSDEYTAATMRSDLDTLLATVAYSDGLFATATTLNWWKPEEQAYYTEMLAIGYPAAFPYQSGVRIVSVYYDAGGSPAKAASSGLDSFPNFAGYFFQETADSSAAQGPPTVQGLFECSAAKTQFDFLGVYSLQFSTISTIYRNNLGGLSGVGVYPLAADSAASNNTAIAATNPFAIDPPAGATIGGTRFFPSLTSANSPFIPAAAMGLGGTFTPGGSYPGSAGTVALSWTNPAVNDYQVSVTVWWDRGFSGGTHLFGYGGGTLAHGATSASLALDAVTVALPAGTVLHCAVATRNHYGVSIPSEHDITV